MTLIIMAAGIGSRYGAGIKQLAKMSEHGEIIMDYSIYDTKQAGFNKVVFVIRKEIEKEFKEAIGNRIESWMDTEYVYQEIDDLPEHFSVPDGRTKPWGTGQALLACRNIVKEPFLVINADDYYGKEAFAKMYQFLESNKKRAAQEEKYRMGMAGFILKNTLSKNGTVTRGICKTDDENHLIEIIETKGIYKENDKIYCDNEAVNQWISEDSKVSMNMWAAYPEFLEYLAQDFVKFLGDISEDPLKKEYLLPNIVAELLKEEKTEVEVLETSDQWIGITYQEDRKIAEDAFRDMRNKGIYPEILWENI